MSELEKKIAELESKREHAWRLYMYYCERLHELREPEEPNLTWPDGEEFDYTP